jgi:hypothetical protein
MSTPSTWSSVITPMVSSNREPRRRRNPPIEGSSGIAVSIGTTPSGARSVASTWAI